MKKRFLGGVLRETVLYGNAIESGQKQFFFPFFFYFYLNAYYF